MRYKASVMILAGILTVLQQRDSRGDQLLGPPTVAAPRVANLPTPADAVRVMVADAQTLPAFDRPFMRYAWIPAQWWHAGAGYAVAAHLGNEVFSQSPALIAPHLIAAGDIYVVRYDLRLYATNEVQLQNLIDTWEQLLPIYFDFGNVFANQKRTKLKIKDGVQQQFQVLFRVKGELEWQDAIFLGEASGDRVKVLWKNKTVFHPAKYTRYVNVQAANVDDVPLRGVAEANVGEDLELAPELGFTAQLLPEELQTNVPAVRLDVLIRQAATTFDQVPFKGLYYDFRGIRGLSLDDWFVLRNVNPLVDNVSNIPILNSEVTGRQRIVQFIPSTEVRPLHSLSFAAVTFDTTLAQQRNLSWTSDKDKFLAEALAHEVFVTLKNGMREYGIYDDQLQLATVPDVVAASRKIPAPHPTVLAAPIDCWRCHDVGETTLGYLTHKSDFIALAQRSPKFRAFFQQDQILKSFAQLNVKQQAAIIGDGFGADVGQLVQDEQQVILFNDFEVFEQNAAQFFTEIQTFLNRAKQDRDRKTRQTAQIGLMSTSRLAVTLYDAYEFVPVTAIEACADIGVQVADLRLAIEVLDHELGTAIGYEDPDLAVLLAGGRLHRGVWERIYKRFAIRTSENRLLNRRGPFKSSLRNNNLHLVP